MNNKIIARIVATVMAIAMLGSLSFAASLTGADLDLTDVTAPTGNTMNTVIAFYADASTAEAPASADDIIAIDQVNDGAAPKTFKIDTTKAAKDYVVVRYGGDAGQTATASITLPKTPETVQVSITPADTYEIGGKIYTNVAYFENTVTPGAGKKLSNYGFKIRNNNASGTEHDIAGATTIEGDAQWKYGVLLVGVQGTPAWEAVGYYTVVDAE